jgi:transcriptional regulator with XRE-family HTH domain
MTPIALRLKELREARGWSQVELAARAKVTQATISRLENGRPKSLDVGVLEKLALALGVNAAVLIVHEPAEKRRKRG